MQMSAKKIVITGLFVAIVSILSIIPTGVNIMGIAATFQTFAMALAGYVLGGRMGSMVTVSYILLGLIIPIYSNMTSGPGILFGPTGGFLFGLIFLAWFCGMAVKSKNPAIQILLSVAGLALCYGIGLLQFSLVSGMDCVGSFVVVGLPYLPKDRISVAMAWIVAKSVRKSINAMDITD